MKYDFIHENRERFGIETMCQAFGVSQSGYYSHLRRGRSSRDTLKEKLRVEIRALFSQHKGRLGSPRMTVLLKRKGYTVGENYVACLMREMGLRAKGKRKFRHTTDSNHTLPVAPNRLDQDFSAQAPNEAWVTDITYIPTREGWLYLCVFVDLFSRAIIGYAMNGRMQASLVTTALSMAYWRRKPGHGVLVHSDRGSQYASAMFRQQLKELRMIQSMSRKGNCYDNAACETVFHTLKVELVHDEDFQTRKEARERIIEYIEMYYNGIRLHSTLGYMSPMEYERKNRA
jgi:transposase InsO family protein